MRRWFFLFLGLPLHSIRYKDIKFGVRNLQHVEASLVGERPWSPSCSHYRWLGKERSTAPSMASLAYRGIWRLVQCCQTRPHGTRQSRRIHPPSVGSLLNQKSDNVRVGVESGRHVQRRVFIGVDCRQIALVGIEELDDLQIPVVETGRHERSQLRSVAFHPIGSLVDEESHDVDAAAESSRQI